MTQNNDEKLIAEQARRIFELSCAVQEIFETLLKAKIQFVGIGGPLNDNKLQFNPQQIEFLNEVHGRAGCRAMTQNNDTLKRITIADVRRWEPCYDPAEYLSEDWAGTALDVLALAEVPPADRLWVILREEVLPPQTLRSLACAFVRHTPLGDGRTTWDLLTDPSSRVAVETAERYAAGLATDADLSAAWSAADSADSAAWSAASAAGSAARSAQIEIAIRVITGDKLK